MYFVGNKVSPQILAVNFLIFFKIVNLAVFLFPEFGFLGECIKIRLIIPWSCELLYNLGVLVFFTIKKYIIIKK